MAVCFVVRAGYRKRGLMHHLLAGAVEHARAHGAEVVEGYPADTGPDRVDVISGYVGTVRMFEAAGFERAAETGGVSGGTAALGDAQGAHRGRRSRLGRVRVSLTA